MKLLGRPVARRSISTAVAITLVLASIVVVTVYGIRHGSEVSLPPQPEGRSVQPVEVGERAPSSALAVDVRFVPDQPKVGQTAEVHVAVTNGGSARADGVEVTLPAPAGTTAVDGPGLTGKDQGWRWPVDRLEPGATSSFVAKVRLDRKPGGGTVSATAQARAGRDAASATGRGGASVRGGEIASASFAPGTAAHLSGRAGQITVDLPATAHRDALRLREADLADVRDELAKRGEAVPSGRAGYGADLGAFVLEATDTAGHQVHSFAAPLTLTLSYTQQQLEALRLNESALTLFWYDPQAKRWSAIPSTLDSDRHTVTASVNHFSTFVLADDTPPSASYLPSLQGWQTAGYTGSVNYSMPIEVPKAAGGMAPELSLSYNSTATDGDTLLEERQSSWVGRGFELGTSFIGLNKASQTKLSTFNLVLKGQSYEVVRGVPLPGGSPADWEFGEWYYYTTEESFLKIRYVTTGAHNDGYFVVWDKDGTRYEFTDLARWAFDDCGVVEPYKWMLTKVTDADSNVMSYFYKREDINDCGTTLTPVIALDRIEYGSNSSVTGSTPMFKVVFTSDDRQQLSPGADPKLVDMVWHSSANQQHGSNGAPHEKYKLNAVTVQAKVNGVWTQVRQYQFHYNVTTQYADNYSCVSNCTDPNNDNKIYGPDPSYRKLTLESTQVLGAGSTPLALPPTTFTYRTDNRGTNKHPNGGWNRLSRVDNGQGGRIDFGYDDIAAVLAAPAEETPYANLFTNRHRVISKRAYNGLGQVALTEYNYGDAAMNWLGRSEEPTPTLPNKYANSAPLFYAQETGTTGDLTVRKQKEFRGHDWMLERTYDGMDNTAPLVSRTKHFYDQGYAATDDPLNPDPAINFCLPATITDACFTSLQEHQFLKGREWKTVVENSAGNPISSTVHRFDLAQPRQSATPVDLTPFPSRGVWRSFPFEATTVERTYDEGDASRYVTVSTRNIYDPKQQTIKGGGSASTHYGNIGFVSVHNGNPNTTAAFTRTRWYATRDDETWDFSTTPPTYTVNYLVDRTWADMTSDEAGRATALQQLFYDDEDFSQRNTPWYIGTKGHLTRTSTYTNVPLQPNQIGVTLTSSDSTFKYDAYGNANRNTQYCRTGTRLSNGTPTGWTVSLPAGDGGNDGTCKRTTSTTFEATTNAYPVQVDNPTAGGVKLTEKTDYDLTLGKPIRRTAQTGKIYTTEYDSLGRPVRIFKPGDVYNGPGDPANSPSIRYAYYDTNRPVATIITEKGGTGTRYTQRIFDGLGQEIQTKTQTVVPTASAGQNLVVDTRYNAAGKVTQKSQARYVDQTDSGGFWFYTPPGANLYRPTTVSYDQAGRTLIKRRPDGVILEDHAYGIWYPTPGAPLQLVHYTVTGNRVLDWTFTDALGRMTVRWEGTGNCDSAQGGDWHGYHCTPEFNVPWGLGGVTTYDYDSRSRLTKVTDARGSITTIGYDSADRKITQTDPDVGTTWYEYDANSNLQAQDNRSGNRIWFSYDEIGRLTQKRAGSASGTLLAEFKYDASTNGKGKRTSMTAYDYDVTAPTSCLGGAVPASCTTTSYTYDDRGRQQLVTQAFTTSTGTNQVSLQYAYDEGNNVTSITYNPTNETVTYTYDAAWRAKSMRSSTGVTFVQDATYTALNQTTRRVYGDNSQDNSSYDANSTFLTNQKVGNSSNQTAYRNASYTYDPVGNIKTWSEPATGTQTFGYDERNRLTSASSTGPQEYTDSYTYDNVGDLTEVHSQANGIETRDTYLYPDVGRPHVHAPDWVAFRTYRYDNRGNVTDVISATSTVNYTWNDLNQLTRHQVSPPPSGGSTTLARYHYDADGQRSVTQLANETRYYLNGLWEQRVSGSITSHKLYRFNGEVVAERDGSGTPTYVHGDHLGSTSVITNSSGRVSPASRYTPWGAGSVGGSSVGFTGQFGENGLVYLGARYYDPALRRFLSADAVIPGSPTGTTEGTALTPLAISYVETGLVEALNSETHDQKRDERDQGGPTNPQALNRYSYVQNNPLKYTDPSGHTWYLDQTQTNELIYELMDIPTKWGLEQAIESPGVGGSRIALEIIKKKAWDWASGVLARAGASYAGLAAAGIGLALVEVVLGSLFIVGSADFGLKLVQSAKLNDFIHQIRKHNTTKAGVALGIEEDGSVTILNRGTGRADRYSAPWWDRLDYNIIGNLPDSMRVGKQPLGDPAWDKNYHFKGDEKWAHRSYVPIVMR